MSEIGIIGQMYEDRRTKKQGRLLSRDEKFKTLLMQSDDGKSFNVSYGGFKSNWRKCDEPEQTLEEAMEEIEIPEKQPNKSLLKKKKSQAPRDVSEGFENFTLYMIDYVKSFNDPNVSIDVLPSKRKVLVRVGRKKAFNVNYMVRTDEYVVCVTEKFFLTIKDKKYVMFAQYNEKWVNTKYSFHISPNNFEKFLVDIRDYVVDMANDL